MAINAVGTSVLKGWLGERCSKTVGVLRRFCEGFVGESVLKWLLGDQWFSWGFVGSSALKVLLGHQCCGGFRVEGVAWRSMLEGCEGFARVLWRLSGGFCAEGGAWPSMLQGLLC